MFGEATAKSPKPGTLVHLASEFRGISSLVRAVVEQAGPGKIARRPSPARWSVAENLIHLKLSSEAYLPIWREAIPHARLEQKTGLEPYQLDAWGRFWVWFLEPPARMRFRTVKRFRPEPLPADEQVLPAFLASQEAVIATLQSGEGLALDKIKIRSAFDARVRYSVWSSFCATLAHQRRHVEQAESAVDQIATQLSKAQVLRSRIMD